MQSSPLAKRKETPESKWAGMNVKALEANAKELRRDYWRRASDETEGGISKTTRLI